jgi:hypothetical protein
LQDLESGIEGRGFFRERFPEGGGAVDKGFLDYLFKGKKNGVTFGK